MNKVILISLGTILFCCCISIIGIHALRNNVQYFIDDTFFDINSTILFECSAFPAANEIQEIIDSNEEYKDVQNFLENNVAFLEGNPIDLLIARSIPEHCPDKFQFEIMYGSHDERVAIERMLKDQKIDNVPVYLINR